MSNQTRTIAAISGVEEHLDERAIFGTVGNEHLVAFNESVGLL